MKESIGWRRQVATWLVAALCLFVSLGPSTALAQPKPKEPPKPEDMKGYTLPYFFTLAGMLLVVVAICTPSHRKWDVGSGGEEE
jgi:hypothetical protein